MTDSKRKGLVTELQCQTYLTNLGFNVSVPLGEDCSYDLIIDIEGLLLRIQVKTCKIESNGITFRTKSSYLTSAGTKVKHYSEEDIDFFATYYNNNCYLIPVSQTGSAEKKLLFDGEKQVNNCAFLEDYVATKIIDCIKEDKPMPNANHLEILQYDLNNNFIQSFSSPKEAAISLNKSQSSHITACAKGKRKTAYGYIWRYK